MADMDKPLTKPQRKALEFMMARPEGVTPKQLAHHLWPDSPGWSRVSNVGHGAAHGIAMPQIAGSLLWRLRRKGYATARYTHEYDNKERMRHLDGWFITYEGQAALKATKEAG
jgi:hypothetical protein